MRLLDNWSGSNDELDFLLEELLNGFNSNDVDFKSNDVEFTDVTDVTIVSNDVEAIDVTTNKIESNDIDVPITDPVELPTKEEPTEPKLDHCTVDDNCLTSIADVRRFVLDRMVEDNEIDLELFFSDQEIVTARRLAVATYNEFPPYVERIQLSDCNQDCLPAPIMFLNGIAYQLYMAKLQKLHKEDVDYQAGGMTVNIIKKRIAYITGNLKIFKTEFENLASSRKTHINYMSAFGRVG